MSIGRQGHASAPDPRNARRALLRSYLAWQFRSMVATRPLRLSLLLLALLVLPVSAQDVGGTWILNVDIGRGGVGEVTLVLEQDGSAVSGTYSGSYGQLVPLSGSVEDGRLLLSFPNDRVGEISYDGVLAPDTVWGSVTYGTRYDGTFEGFRRPPATIVSTVVGYAVMALVLLFAVGLIVMSVRRG